MHLLEWTPLAAVKGGPQNGVSLNENGEGLLEERSIAQRALNRNRHLHLVGVVGAGPLQEPPDPFLGIGEELSIAGRGSLHRSRWNRSVAGDDEFRQGLDGWVGEKSTRRQVNSEPVAQTR
jgi:hypothetical protein